MQSQTAALRRTTACPGCGLVLPAHAGPIHAYFGASAACWHLYRELLTDSRARETGTRVRRLAEDTYAVQHPGVNRRRCLQSVAVHLMGLCVLLEREGEERKLVPVLGRMPSRRTLALYWLTPPEPNGHLTVVEAAQGLAGEGRDATIELWARDLWEAWAPHHETVRGWLDAPALRVA
jgi:hypothetical protein